MALDFLSSHWNFTGVDKLYYELNDVYVESKTGIIFDNKFEPVFKMLYEALFWGPAIPAKAFKEPILMYELLCKKYAKISKTADDLKDIVEGNDSVESFDEAIHLLHPFGWYAYGHLHDSLMKLHSMPNLMRESTLLCSDYRRIVDFEIHIDALGYDSNKIKDRRFLSRFVHVEKLHLPINPSVPTNYTEASYKWMIQQYSAKLSQNCPIVKDFEGIYLSRNTVKVGKRGVINEAEVTEYLRAENFIILDGTQNLNEIYSYFSKAKYIIGAHGSMFVNTIFTQSTAKILEFCPKNRPDYSFKKKLKNCKNYSHLLVEADNDFNIEIDMAVIKGFLNE